MKNSTETGKASPSSGAIFLQNFVEKTPWIHIDIAGTAYLSKGRGYLDEGATGIPVRTLVELIKGDE
jgi:leucyl aminopeptidase